MRVMKVVSLLCVAGAAAVLGGCNDKAAAPKPTAVEVGVLTMAPRRVEVVADLQGRTSAYRVAEVRPQVSGILQKRLFTEGAEVKAGERLYQIDPAKYQATLASAEAALAKARANVKAVEAKAARYAELVGINAVSKQDYDDITASLAQNQADVKAAEAAVDLARIDLEYTRVYAPISGRIGKSAVTEGALVTANQATALATVTQLDPIYVDLTQSSDEMARLRREAEAGKVRGGGTRGAEVSLSSPGDGHAYAETGRLQFSDVTVDRTTGSVTIRALFPNPNRELLPGMFVRARVRQGERDNVLVVPQGAVQRTGSQASVWVAGADGKAAVRTVTLGDAVSDGWLVNSGLAAGDRVVVEGLQRMRPGIPVKAVEIAQAN